LQLTRFGPSHLAASKEKTKRHWFLDLLRRKRIRDASSARKTSYKALSNLHLRLSGDDHPDRRPPFRGYDAARFTYDDHLEVFAQQRSASWIRTSQGSRSTPDIPEFFSTPSPDPNSRSTLRSEVRLRPSPTPQGKISHQVPSTFSVS